MMPNRKRRRSRFRFSLPSQEAVVASVNPAGASAPPNPLTQAQTKLRRLMTLYSRRRREGELRKAENAAKIRELRAEFFELEQEIAITAARAGRKTAANSIVTHNHQHTALLKHEEVDADGTAEPTSVVAAAPAARPPTAPLPTSASLLVGFDTKVPLTAFLAQVKNSHDEMAKAQNQLTILHLDCEQLSRQMSVAQIEEKELKRLRWTFNQIEDDDEMKALFAELANMEGKIELADDAAADMRMMLRDLDVSLAEKQTALGLLATTLAAADQRINRRASFGADEGRNMLYPSHDLSATVEAGANASAAALNRGQRVLRRLSAGGGTFWATPSAPASAPASALASGAASPALKPSSFPASPLPMDFLALPPSNVPAATSTAAFNAPSLSSLLSALNILQNGASVAGENSKGDADGESREATEPPGAAGPWRKAEHQLSSLLVQGYTGQQSSQGGGQNAFKEDVKPSLSFALERAAAVMAGLPLSLPPKPPQERPATAKAKQESQRKPEQDQEAHEDDDGPQHSGRAMISLLVDLQVSSSPVGASRKKNNPPQFVQETGTIGSWGDGEGGSNLAEIALSDTGAATPLAFDSFGAPISGPLSVLSGRSGFGTFNSFHSVGAAGLQLRQEDTSTADGALHARQSRRPQNALSRNTSKKQPSLVAEEETETLLAESDVGTADASVSLAGSITTASPQCSPSPLAPVSHSPNHRQQQQQRQTIALGTGEFGPYTRAGRRRKNLPDPLPPPPLGAEEVLLPLVQERSSKPFVSKHEVPLRSFAANAANVVAASEAMSLRKHRAASESAERRRPATAGRPASRAISPPGVAMGMGMRHSWNEGEFERATSAAVARAALASRSPSPPLEEERRPPSVAREEVMTANVGDQARGWTATASNGGGGSAVSWAGRLAEQMLVDDGANNEVASFAGRPSTSPSTANANANNRRAFSGGGALAAGGDGSVDAFLLELNALPLTLRVRRPATANGGRGHSPNGSRSLTVSLTAEEETPTVIVQDALHTAEQGNEKKDGYFDGESPSPNPFSNRLVLPGRASYCPATSVYPLPPGGAAGALSTQASRRNSLSASRRLSGISSLTAGLSIGSGNPQEADAPDALLGAGISLPVADSGTVNGELAFLHYHYDPMLAQSHSGSSSPQVSGGGVPVPSMRLVPFGIAEIGFDLPEAADAAIAGKKHGGLKTLAKIRSSQSASAAAGIGAGESKEGDQSGANSPSVSSPPTPLPPLPPLSKAAVPGLSVVASAVSPSGPPRSLQSSTKGASLGNRRTPQLFPLPPSPASPEKLFQPQSIGFDDDHEHGSSAGPALLTAEDLEESIDGVFSIDGRIKSPLLAKGPKQPRFSNAIALEESSIFSPVGMSQGLFPTGSVVGHAPALEGGASLGQWTDRGSAALPAEPRNAPVSSALRRASFHPPSVALGGRKLTVAAALARPSTGGKRKSDTLLPPVPGPSASPPTSALSGGVAADDSMAINNAMWSCGDDHQITPGNKGLDNRAPSVLPVGSPLSPLSPAQPVALSFGVAASRPRMRLLSAGSSAGKTRRGAEEPVPEDLTVFGSPAAVPMKEDLACASIDGSGSAIDSAQLPDGDESLFLPSMSLMEESSLLCDERD